MRGNTYEPPVRIELTTCALQVRCSTTELERPRCKHIPGFRTAAIMAVIWRNLKSRGLGASLDLQPTPKPAD